MSSAAGQQITGWEENQKQNPSRLLHSNLKEQSLPGVHGFKSSGPAN